MIATIHRLTSWFATSQRALLVLWALYLVPRALLILLDVTPSSDGDYYYGRAAELAAGKGYVTPEGAPTAFWPPGWPMVLSAAFRALGTSTLTVGLLNLACAAVSAWLILGLARRVGGSELAARLALLLVALYPNNAAYVPLALTEVFYSMLLLAICWLLVAGRDWQAVLAAGLLLGLATLVKAQTLAVVPLVLGIGVLRAGRFWKAMPGAIGKGLALGCLAALVVLPWSLRNQRELGEFVAVSTNSGVTLLTGNNASARGSYTDVDSAYLALRARTDLTEIASDAEAKRIATDWIKANPGQFIALMPAKFFHLWAPDGEAIWAYEAGAPSFAAARPAYVAVRLANQAWYWLLLLGAAAACVLQLKRRWQGGGQLWDWWLLPYGIAAYPTAICVVFSGQMRFHYPAMPFLAMSCGWLLADWIRRRSASTA